MRLIVRGLIVAEAALWPLDVRSRLARNVKLKAERGWSQEDLADQPGLDRTYIVSTSRASSGFAAS